tara:strand:- start:1206 stop:4115 length:2910 start_codon:yes stop_codon:yes gene_type:complete
MGETITQNPGCLTLGDTCYGARQDPNKPIDYHDGLYCCGVIIKDDDDGNTELVGDVKGDGKNPNTGQSIYKKLCLTELGLTYWAQILGQDYNAWFNSGGADTTLYGCEEISQLEEIQNNVGQPLYTDDCDYKVSEKGKALTEIQQYGKLIQQLTKQNANIKNQIAELESQTTTTTIKAACTSYVDLFENFNVSFALEVLSGNTYTPVYEETIFNIGAGNLWNYIVESSGNTGIIIGDSNITLGEETDLETDCNDKLINNIISEVGRLIPQGDTKEPVEPTDGIETIDGRTPTDTRVPIDGRTPTDTRVPSSLKPVTPYRPDGLPFEPIDPVKPVKPVKPDFKEILFGWWDSCWLKFKADICDRETINKIINQKINMVFYINNSCVDFQIMLDRVKLTKTCQKTINEETFISEPPKFEITKVIDNKKSWVALDSKDERFYDLKYRPTEYDVNHHKLVINTKEIDLNLSPARAVEQDVWCYMNDNDILACSGTSNPQINCIFKWAPYQINSPLPEITNVWDYNSSTNASTSYNNSVQNQINIVKLSDGDLVIPTIIILDPDGNPLVDGGTYTFEFYLSRNTSYQNVFPNDSFTIQFGNGPDATIITIDENTSEGLYQFEVTASQGSLGANQMIITIINDNLGTISSAYTIEDFRIGAEDCSNEEDCGDNCIDLSGKLTTDLVEVDSVEEFTNIIYSELIDAKNRQTISAYPTLKLLYERYNYNSLDFSNFQSSQYDYFDMDNFGLNVNNYWVDLIEQVVPATTIWESTYEYRNTVFDTQKYKYRHNNIYWGRDPSGQFPFSAVSSDNSVSVIVEELPPVDINETKPLPITSPVIGDDGEIIVRPNEPAEPVSPVEPVRPVEPVEPVRPVEPVGESSSRNKRSEEEKIKEQKELKDKYELESQYDSVIVKPLKPVVMEVSGVWEMQHTCSPEFLGTVNIISDIKDPDIKDPNTGVGVITIGNGGIKVPPSNS